MLNYKYIYKWNEKYINTDDGIIRTSYDQRDASKMSAIDIVFNELDFESYDIHDYDLYVIYCNKDNELHEAKAYTSEAENELTEYLLGRCLLLSNGDWSISSTDYIYKNEVFQLESTLCGFSFENDVVITSLEQDTRKYRITASQLFKRFDIYNRIHDHTHHENVY